MQNKTNKAKDFYMEYLFLGAIAVTIAIVLYITFNFDIPDMKIDNESVMNINNSWTVNYEMSENVVVDIPITIDEDTYRFVTIEKVLPPETPVNATICIDTLSQNISVSVDGENVYEYWIDNNVPFGKMFGTMWHIIRLPEHSAGKTIEITAQTHLEKGESTMRSCILGTKAAILFELLNQTKLTVILCITIFLFGIAMLIKCISAHNRKLHLDIAMLSILTAIWLFTDTSLPQLFFSNQAACYVVSYCSFMLMFVPFFLLIKELCLPSRKKFVNHICMIILAMFALNMLLYIFNIVALSTSINFIHAVVLISLIIVVVFIIKDYQKESRTDFIFFISACVLLLIFALIELYHYHYVSSSAGSHYFRIGIILFSVILCTRAVMNSRRAFTSDVKTTLLERLAFVDTLTELSNRAIFELDRNQLNEDMFEYNTVGFAVLDIDGLKVVNDNYGHTNGDILINAAAKCISYAFSKLGKIYRIGGDEFAIIFYNTDENHIDNAVVALQENVDVYNESAKFPLGISVGYSLTKVVSAKHTNLLALFDEADKKMYADKVSRKANRE